jgi:hypothetical protein
MLACLRKRRINRLSELQPAPIFFQIDLDIHKLPLNHFVSYHRRRRSCIAKLYVMNPLNCEGVGGKLYAYSFTVNTVKY